MAPCSVSTKTQLAYVSE